VAEAWLNGEEYPEELLIEIEEELQRIYAERDAAEWNRSLKTDRVTFTVTHKQLEIIKQALRHFVDEPEYDSAALNLLDELELQAERDAEK
jgi:hypothetical protein